MSRKLDMCKRYIIILLLFCCAWEPSLAQQSYVLARQKNNDHDDDQYAIMSFDVLTGDREILFELIASRFAHPNETGWTRIIYSFEFSKNMQQVYFLEREGDLYLYDIASDNMTYIKDLAPANMPFDVHFYRLTLQIDRVNDSLLLVSGNTYGLYNENTQLFTETRLIPDFSSASIPREMEITARRTARHKDGFVYNGGCVCLNEVNVEDPSQNIVLFDYDVTPDISVALENIVSYQYDCDSTQLYFVDVADSLRIWRIDEEDGELSLYDAYCNFSGKHPYQLSDVQHYNATPWEDCQRIIDLDEDDSSGAYGVDFMGDSLCIHTDLPIVDSDVYLQNEQALDSIVVYIEQAQTGQQLQLAMGNYDLQVYSDSRVSIVSNTTTSLAEIEQALVSARYIDTAPYRAGDVEIIFELWYRGVRGTAAISYLHIPEMPYAGADVFLAFCVEGLVVNLEDMLEDNVSPGNFYIKNTAQLFDNALDLADPQSYTLIYVSGSAYCTDTACVTIDVLPLPSLITIQDTVLCEGDSVLIDLQALEGDIIWSDNNIEKSRIIEEAGNYAYEHIDDAGCVAREEFVVSYMATEIVEDISYVEICVGETYPYNGLEYAEDILLLDTLLSVDGCDSIIRGLSLKVLEEIDVVIEGSTQVCEGENVSLQIVSPFAEAYLDDNIVGESIAIDASGSYVLEVIDDQGCILEIVIEITNYPTSIIDIVDIENLAYAEPIDVDVSYVGDIISYSWLPTQGLSCYDCPYPMLTEAGVEQYTVLIQDIYGCTYEERLSISYQSGSYYLPNIISTTSDDIVNSSFHLMSNKDIRYDLIIYDRWGNALYTAERLSSNEFSSGWIPDQNVQPGVYVYIVKLQDDTEELLTGNITVIR